MKLTVWISARSQGQDMRLIASPRHFRSLVILPIWAAVLAFPASAQTGSDTNSTGAASVRAQSVLTGAPTSSNPATAGSNTPSTQTNSSAVKAESEPGGSQPESN